jgi:3-methyladenine DNA glycosylase AlkD
VREKDAAVGVATFVREVAKAFERDRDPALAEPMSKYMRYRFPFLGLPAPKQAAALRPLLHPHFDEAFLLAAAQRLWKKKEREFHHAGALLLLKNHKSLSAASLGALRELLESNSWWDTVDTLSTRVIGPIVLRHPRLQYEMDEWSRDANFWVRRCAIIHQLSFKESTDVERLFAYCAANAQDSEFFIRKAIGWALRQYARTDARAVIAFVNDHPELSTLSRREALKHCL